MSNVDATYNWYALYTRSRFEKKLDQNLKNLGIETYLPLRSEKKQWSDRVKVIEEPLLKGYLFVKVSNREYFDVVNNPGAVCYVSFEGKAATIPEKQIRDLMQFVDCYNESLNVTRERISKGDKVKVKSGLLKGVHGEIIEFRGSKRIVLRFENLGYCIHTDISMDQVEYIGKKNS